MALDYALDRKVRFVPESEYKSLYAWSLQEFDEAGKKIGSPQVPWSWSLYFTATEVCLHESLKLDHDGPVLKKIEPILEKLEDWKLKTEERSHVSATLRPGYHAKDDDDVEYSMFGTSRTIKDFALAIHPLDNETDDEHATAWGSPQFSSEGPKLLPETIDDTVQFYLHVKPSRFAQYAEMVKKHPANILTLRLSSVMGMYSEWSPAVQTDHVKILANAVDQQLEIANEAGVKPRELGWIGTFEITFSTRREGLKRPQSTTTNDEEVLDAITTAESISGDVTLTQRALLQLAIQQRDRSKQLLYAAWAVVVLLVILVSRH